METKFYRCPICGNIVVKMHDGGPIPLCCGEEMKELSANTSDGKQEYHVPVAEVTDDNCVNVKIGKEPHPMTKEHYIQWIFVDFMTKNGRQGGFFVKLKPDDKPEYKFCVCNLNVVNIYGYCNLHGLWKLHVVDEDQKDAEACGMYPAFCGQGPAGPQDAYYFCD